MSIGWRFAELRGGPEQGFNESGIATFKGSELHENLAREICQNSLDAHIDNNDEPVRVEFLLERHKVSDYNAIEQLQDVIRLCELEVNNDEKLKNFIKEAKEHLESGFIESLVIRDYNTTGLTGASEDGKTVWKALVSSNGITVKASGSAGSHGIGKSAPFAASLFRTVFYNTLAVDDISAFQGVAKLVSHTQNNERTIGTGYYYNTISDKSWAPLYDEKDPFYEKYKRNGKNYGTDVIILGYRKSENWEEIIERAIINNFFMALYENKLAVRIGERELTKQTLPQRIEHYTQELDVRKEADKKMKQTQEFYQTIVDVDKENAKVSSILEDNDVMLYLKKDKKYSKQIIYMRATGMRVRIRGLHILTPFAAVFIAKGKKLNDLLKKMEPPCHDKWDAEEIEGDNDTKKKALEVHRKIVNWVQETIRRECIGESVEEFSPDGISEFLSYDEDIVDVDSSVSPNNSDDLPSASVIMNARVSNMKQQTRQLEARKTSGTKEEHSEVHNQRGGGKGKSYTSSGNEDDGKDNIAVPDVGTKKIDVPKILFQRAFPLSAAHGIYDINFTIDKDDDEVYLYFYALYDDGNKEHVVVKQYRYNNANIVATKGCVGPLKIIGGKLNKIITTFEITEKMTLEINVR